MNVNLVTLRSFASFSLNAFVTFYGGPIPSGLFAWTLRSVSQSRTTPSPPSVCDDTESLRESKHVVLSRSHIQDCSVQGDKTHGHHYLFDGSTVPNLASVCPSEASSCAPPFMCENSLLCGCTRPPALTSVISPNSPGPL